MYGQGNLNSQGGQSLQTPMPPPYRQQLPGPPPLPPHFQQGLPGPPPSTIQRVPNVYQHGHPVPPPAVRQVPPGSMPNPSHSYVHTPPTAHGSTLPMPQIYPTDQQNIPRHSHLGTQQVHHMPPPPRVLLPPPPPPTMHRPPPPPLPLPPTSSFSTSRPFGSFVQSTSGNSLMPPMAPLPPPPPFSPPPIPPAPPSATTSLSLLGHDQAASSMTSSSLLSFDKDITKNEVRDNAHSDDRYPNRGDSSKGSVVFDLPAPPPRPSKEEVVQRIVDLCRLIVKNGPGYEDLARQNESGNPEFCFLNGGDPGSEDAIAHEFFLWMKKKCILDYKLGEERKDLPLRPLGIEATTHPQHALVTAGSDSDLEMEDDITQCDDGGVITHSDEGRNSQHELIHLNIDVKEQFHERKNSAAGHQLKETSSENVSISCSPVLAEEDTGQKGLSDYHLFACESSVSRATLVTSSADEVCTLTNIKELETPIGNDKVHSGASEAREGSNCERNSSLLVKGGSPFRLLQEYASDDSSEKSDKLCHKNVAAVGAMSSSENVTCHLKADLESKSNEGDSGLATGLNISREALDALQDSGQGVKKTVGTTGEQDDKNEKRDSICHMSSDSFNIKDVLGGALGEVYSSGKLEKEDKERSANSAPSSPKVDKFGRLVRQGASDSDSDDSHYNGRHRRRDRSRSRSPRDRWKRSPRRRREKRSRSRSWSPRNRRSRSRSPRNIRKRSRSPRKRRSRSRSPVLRHIGEFNGDSTRRNRGQIPDCFDFRRGRCFRGAACRYMHHDFDKSDGSRGHRSKQQYSESAAFSKNSNIHVEVRHKLYKESDQEHGEDSVNTAAQSGRFKGDTLADSRAIESESSREAVVKELDTQVLPEETEMTTTVADNSRSLAVGSQDVLPREDSISKQSGSSLSGPLLQNIDLLPLQTDNSSMSDSAPRQALMGSENKLSATEALPGTAAFRNNSQQLPPPPPIPFTQGITCQPMSQPLIPPTAAPQISSTSGEMFPSYMLPNQQSHFSVPPVASWRSLPPPPLGASPQLQQSHLHPRNDFGSQISSRPYVADTARHSQVSGFQQQPYPPMQGHFVTQLPSYNLQSQQFPRPSLLRDEHTTQHPTTGLNASSSISKTYMQQPQYGTHHQSVTMGSSSIYVPDSLGANQSSHLSDSRGPRNSNYYNPYASTFEQPLNSRFSSDVFEPVDRQGIGSIGSKQEISSPNSARAIGQNFTRSGGDRYDPLFDSIEPSSNLINKVNSVQKWEASSESDIMLRNSGSNKPLDIVENNKKEVGSVVLGTSADNEEFGETADAEVGAVENGSPSDSANADDLSAGDIEIDQMKSPGKGKKNKESRSMKLFKVALADFVKEILKPSWRQGNMSKEAFKTIVKKTVDKVSASMKNHHIPKSRAKIDHYIDTQQRKLTKLVTGYVDKYVKA